MSYRPTLCIDPKTRITLPSATVWRDGTRMVGLAGDKGVERVQSKAVVDGDARLRRVIL